MYVVERLNKSLMLFYIDVQGTAVHLPDTIPVASYDIDLIGICNK